MRREWHEGITVTVKYSPSTGDKSSGEDSKTDWFEH